MKGERKEMRVDNHFLDFSYDESDLCTFFYKSSISAVSWSWLLNAQLKMFDHNDNAVLVAEAHRAHAYLYKGESLVLDMYLRGD